MQEDFLKGKFYNPTCGQIVLNEVLQEIVAYMKEKPEKFYNLVVGCDYSSEEYPNFPVALVILRTGEGGRFFLKKIFYKDRKFHTWKTRILQEVFLSCQMASFLKEKIEGKIREANSNPNYEFRYINADVG